MPKIKGKIAALMGRHKIVINKGTVHSVTEGMVFKILLEIPPITDPDDPTNVLDGLYYEKGRLKIDQVYDKMSFGTLLPSGTTATTGSSGTSKSTTPLSQVISELQQSVQATYPRVDDDTYVVSIDDWIIRVGDNVLNVE